MAKEQRYWDSELNDWVVVTWEYDGEGQRNRMFSQPMSKEQAREIARRKRDEDENVHAAATPARHRKLFGR